MFLAVVLLLAAFRLQFSYKVSMLMCWTQMVVGPASSKHSILRILLLQPMFLAVGQPPLMAPLAYTSKAGMHILLATVNSRCSMYQIRPARLTSRLEEQQR